MDKLISRAIRFLLILALIILVVSLASGVVEFHIHK